MSVVCVLAPVVIASWPTFSAAVVAAAASLGYSAVDSRLEQKRSLGSKTAASSVHLEIAQSEIVTDSLGRGEKVSVARDGVVVTFSRDPRGKAALHVEGAGREEAGLRTLGEELGRRVVQAYVYQRLKDEMASRNFVLVEEEIHEDASIRLRVRHWDQ